MSIRNGLVAMFLVFVVGIAALGIVGSACSPAKTAAGVTAGVNEAVCILDHADEPPEQIVKDCAEVTLEGVKKIIAAQHRSFARSAAAASASSSASPSASTSASSGK